MTQKPTLAFLYGTAWKENDTERCVTDALKAGFRGIDTANQRKHYFEAGVGAALKKYFENGELLRSDLFLQTKFTYLRGQDERLPYDSTAALSVQVQQSFESSLQHLNTDYIDSYVLHGPSNAHDLSADDWEVWQTMEQLCKAGKTKQLGVSNIELNQLSSLVQGASIKPTYVQNRCFARTGWDMQIRDYCTAQKIIYQGFSLLTANSEIFGHPHFAEILQRKKCTAAQLVFCFARQIGMLPLTGTTDFEHMSEDLDSLKLELSAQDLHAISNLLT